MNFFYLGLSIRSSNKKSNVNFFDLKEIRKSVKLKVVKHNKGCNLTIA